MGIAARLRDFHVFVLLALVLLVSASRARADDAFVLNKRAPTLNSLVPRAQVQTVAEAAEPATAPAPAGPICDIFANGYDIPGATPCAGCFDGTIDFNGTDVDCGGVYCNACADGKHCAVGGDCSSGVCNTSTTMCAPASCANNGRDGNETDVDCGGGTCPACGVGKMCLAGSDCTSNACDALSHTCVADQCMDHLADGSETDIDCGGAICSACAVGKMCMADTDCTSNACDALSHTCVASQCLDHRTDGSETDIDCGGGTCPACGTGLKCKADPDCVSNACDALSFTCIANQCLDHRQDGQESDVDCGGGTCAACSTGKKCHNSMDCQPGHVCGGGFCQ